MIRVAAYQGNSGVSIAIKFITRSRYSHVAFLLDDGSVVEAWDYGLRRVSSLSAQHNIKTFVDVFSLVDFTTYQNDLLYESILKDLKNPPKYDFKQVLHFLPIVRFFSRDVPDNGKYFCSEYVFCKLKEVGFNLFENTQGFEVPPDWIPRSPKLRFDFTDITS